jgi:hypothetical protein
MANIDNILKTVQKQTKALAQNLFRQYTQQAMTDVQDFLEKSKSDLKRWAQQLAEKKIDADEFASLVQGKLDVAEMKALKQAGLAQVQLDTFTNGVVDIIVQAAVAAIP